MWVCVWWIQVCVPIQDIDMELMLVGVVRCICLYNALCCVALQAD